MRLSTLILFLSLSCLSFGQKRIGADVNTHLINLNFSIHYQEVIKGPLLYSAGMFFGNYGQGFNVGSAEAVALKHDLGKTFPRMDSQKADTNGVYDLIAYAEKGNGIGLYAGIGLFHEFGNFHGLRFNLNNRIGWMTSRVSSTYYLEEAQRVKRLHNKFYHPSGALSLEFYHTIRMSGRNTFYWGVKVPYYYSLDRGRYAPKVDSELFYKFKMDLSIGFTHAVGKCD